MRVFVTGLTGTLGTALARLHRERGDEVWGCSRSEERAVRWLNWNRHLATLYLTDVLTLDDSKTDAYRALRCCDRVYHCAAMKHVDLCEKQPYEAFIQNVTATQIVSTVCYSVKIPLVFVSSDKACLPESTYGATKLLAERIVLREGGAVVRLANLIGSSGSVFKMWSDAVKTGGKVRLTDPNMTRYFMGVKDATRFVADAHHMGDLIAPQLLAARMGTIATALAESCGNNSNIEVIGPRPGETTHQWLVAPGERTSTGNDYIVIGDPSGMVCQRGLSSQWAEQWETDDLLKQAGIEK